ncbi:all-trans retinoic acid-induced differentiation factor-like [Mercenaria mercenaria]|uniref:all-trans retinoic acid-induced differentiation factor-like n=1 Tax=Mercenaria mercenaria TaxID=6596 RepID=UPI00234F8BAF|nr:all-trans retinoic acid-induced differentiation factor-like [Mercenaria mercenaria]
MCQNMKKLYFFASFVYFICLITTTIETDTHSKICSQCTTPPKVDSYLVQFCRKENGTGLLHQDNSCCINSTVSSQTSLIVGVDMSGCGLKTISGLFSNMHDLKVIMLENNTDLQIKQDDFNGLSKLLYLSLPDFLQCPGGNKSWNSVEKQNNTVICEEEINLCVKNNVTCQNSNSHCVLTGPGVMECLCLPGYHGYKCLRQGTFPAVSYSIIICVCTAVISGFLWCTQRRKVKKKTHTY